MKMKRVVIPLAHGFEEIETVTVVDILRRAGISVTIAGVEGGTPPAAVEGRTGIKLVPDMTIDEVEATDFDMIVLPGGLKAPRLSQRTRGWPDCCLCSKKESGTSLPSALP